MTDEQHIPAFLLQSLKFYGGKKNPYFCYARSHCQPFAEHRLD